MGFLLYLSEVVPLIPKRIGPMKTASEIVATAISMEPRKRGIYFLILGAEIVYVGQSIDINARLFEHRRGHMSFSRWAWIECAAGSLDPIERAYIDAFLPKHNQDSKTRAKRGDNNAPPCELGLTEADIARWHVETDDDGSEIPERMRHLRELKKSYSPSL